MGENSAIEWTDHTFNPWVGCTKVSPACDNCYAEGWAKRTGQSGLWRGERRRTSASNWKTPVTWNRWAERDGVRRKVFCASLADVFDNQVPDEWRADLWRLIASTPHLDWQLLTKRPQNIAKMLPGDWGHGYANVWLGTTVESRDEADRRIQHLQAVPARVRFLSCEPMLGDVSLRWLSGVPYNDRLNAGRSVNEYDGAKGIHWVIAGGESGGKRRPMDLAWPRKLRDECRDLGAAFFMKQIDKVLPIPADLMIREFPSSPTPAIPDGALR
jgi:protein gp37